MAKTAGKKVPASKKAKKETYSRGKSETACHYNTSRDYLFTEHQHCKVLRSHLETRCYTNGGLAQSAPSLQSYRLAWLGVCIRFCPTRPAHKL